MTLKGGFEKLIEALYAVELNPTDHIQFEVSMAVMEHLVPADEFKQLKPGTTVIMNTDARDSIQLHIMDTADEQPIDGGHEFTTAGFSDDATCDKCHIGILEYKKEGTLCR